MHTQRMTTHTRFFGLAVTVMICLVVGVLFAQIDRPAKAQQNTPIHPTFQLLDEDKLSVLETGKPVSTMQTCGACHDTAFIASNSFHADVGLSATVSPCQQNTENIVNASHSWDTSPGLFGRWNSITYRYLSPADDTRFDLTTPEWIQVFGARHVGGGPAVTSRDGCLLTKLPNGATQTTSVPGDTFVNLKSDAPTVDTHIVDASGKAVPWDWKASGVEEMNCFLCHLAAPNNDARIAALKAGQFQWANSATLLGTGIVTENSGRYIWNQNAFDDTGKLLAEYVTVQDPRSANCGQCHGLVFPNTQDPLTLTAFSPTNLGAWNTLTTGQIMSPQKVLNSGVNLSNKNTLDRTWDVHGERVLNCTNCHYSVNNPIYYRETSKDRPEHLVFDPRRLDLSEYLYRPSHQFATGQNTLAPESNNALRRCESCHSMETTHDWLPYKDRHTAALSCETCHIPRLYGPALQSVDWTFPNTDGSAQYTYRGIEGAPQPVSITATTLINGYEPVLLPRKNADGTTSLAPFNVVSAWYWIYGDPARPVPLRDLQAAFLENGSYRPEVLGTFDADKNGTLETGERFIDTAEKQATIAKLLAARGLDNPRIMGETQPYSINHNVTAGEWAIRECRTCHGDDSRLNQAILLSNRTPGGVQPTFITDAAVAGGALQADDTGSLYLEPASSAPPTNLYVFGHDAVYWIDWAGMLMLFGVSLGVFAHGGLRYLAMRRLKPHAGELKRVYMYSIYERFWHWLQTGLILGLLITGIVIHEPDKFGALSFGFVVQVHNILALILVINAALSLFYHLVSGEIRQFLPKPHGFFNDMIEQAKFYLRGIFRGEAHPFEKRPERKLNPLQQMTYLAILNVLLPLQVITGALMWGAQHFPNIAQALGGLPLLAPLHTLVAWLFASFIIMHVYLTTTGPKPFTYVKAMMLGWDEVESHSATLHAPSSVSTSEPTSAPDLPQMPKEETGL